MTAEELYQLGTALASQGDVSRSMDALEQAVELDPDHAPACKLLAKLALQINERRAFVNWCHEASRIAPEDPEPYQMMADELQRMGRNDEAEEARQAAKRRQSPQRSTSTRQL